MELLTAGRGLPAEAAWGPIIVIVIIGTRPVRIVIIGMIGMIGIQHGNNSNKSNDSDKAILVSKIGNDSIDCHS